MVQSWWTLTWGLCWAYWSLKAGMTFMQGAQSTSQRCLPTYGSLYEDQIRRRCHQSSPEIMALCVQYIFLDSCYDSLTVFLLIAGVLHLPAVALILAVGLKRERAVGGTSYLVLHLIPPHPNHLNNRGQLFCAMERLPINLLESLIGLPLRLLCPALLTNLCEESKMPFV